MHYKHLEISIFIPSVYKKNPLSRYFYVFFQDDTSLIFKINSLLSFGTFGINHQDFGDFYAKRCFLTHKNPYYYL